MSADLFRFADELGPIKIVHVHDPGSGMKGIVVVDNVACGPAIGGIRMAPDVSVEECFRLARAMTLKNAAAGLPHGGGKSVMFGDPHMPEGEKEPLIRAFAQAIRGLTDYIPGPDMGTDERCMGWVKDEIGRAVGLPRTVGGIPLDEIGATGLGCAVAAEAAEPYSGVAVKGARVAIQGFGAVGTHAARFLAERGAVIVAVSDSSTTLAAPGGLDVEKAIALKRSGGRLADYAGGVVRPADAVLDVECEIWIPAARPDVLRADTIGRLKTKLIVQGANIPATPEAEAALAARGVLSLPDFIANAGGVICAAVEYHGGSQAAAFEAIREKIARNVRETLEGARAGGMLPRQAAEALARRRIADAASTRRRF
ncbi:MAG: Glu/Leu/Phe/Val dehydrogenase [Alphaproteobacteria bacterium]